MSAAAAPAAAMPHALSGRALLLVRALWLILALASLMLFTAGIPARYAELTTLCAGGDCPYGQLLPGQSAALARVGITLHGYAVFDIAMDGILTLAYAGLAILIFVRRSHELMALIASLWLVLFAASNSTGEALTTALPASAPLFAFLDQIGWVVLPPLFLLIFPDGRFVPRWSRWAYLLFLLVSGSSTHLAGHLSNAASLELLATSLWSAIHITGIGAQIYRYRRVSGALERQQTKLFVMGLVATAALLAATIVFQAGSSSPAADPGLASLVEVLPKRAIVTLAFLFIPVTLAFSILRHRLWDIDLIVNRTLLYATVTALLIGLYVLVVGLLGSLFHAQGNLIVSILATGLIAAVFHPLRVRLQRLFNRALYGLRDEPGSVIASLGKRLESVPPLEAIVETITETLRLPYAAIALQRENGSGLEIVAQSTGAPAQDGTLNRVRPPLQSDFEGFPIEYQSQYYGDLIVERRSPGELWNAQDQQLLRSIASQTAVVVNALQLAGNLQQAREQLVAAREEERLRLRRDLHDGLGPAVAAQLLKLGSARALIQGNPAAADGLLAELETQTEASMAEVRRLIYGLRPPELDEQGLVGAMTKSIEEYRRPSPPAAWWREAALPEIRLQAPERLPNLPAAVEVAAYRIFQEALVNVVRHGHSRNCTVRLEAGQELIVEITDDGIGLPHNLKPGVGLASMRERALELGGRFSIESHRDGGTRVFACLPLEFGG